jgi:lysophospholipase L1-like esterase
MSARFTHYVALGDSMSIDRYPALDVADKVVPFGQDVGDEIMRPLGSASLLHRNDDERWPDFAGRDLATLMMPDVALVSLATDGATIGEVFADQLLELEVPESAGATTLVTLTVGGNDLLAAFANGASAKLLANVARDTVDAYGHLVDAIAARLPGCTMLLTTVYDPSDLSGDVPGVLEERGPFPLQQMDRVNDGIRDVAERTAGAILADAHTRFMGHGVTAPPAERWYWRRSLIEPSALGASELRRLWLDVLGL